MGKPFGGYELSFKGQDVTMEEVMGDKPLTPAQMTKTLWQHVKKHKLSNKQ